MILLTNATYIDEAFRFRRSDLAVEEGDGGGLVFDPGPEQRKRATRVIDCEGKYITRSFANAHHHAYSALARGMPPPPQTPGNFREVLTYVWWRLDKSLDPGTIRSSALATAVACAKRGVTFVVDHHASPHAVDGSMGILAEAFDEVGIGHLLCYEISDRDGKEIALAGLAETDKYLSQRPGLVGLHASFTVGDETMDHAVELAARHQSGIHIHVAEDPCDQEQATARYGKRVVQRLHDRGVLGFPKTILAHCLHLDPEERALVAASPAWVAQNMESNLNNRVGLFRPDGLGDRILLGTDGMHSDMMQSARAAYFAGRTTDPAGPADLLRRLRRVHDYLQQNDIPGDGDNNLVVFGYDTPTPLNETNFPGHFFYGLESRHITHVIARGRLITEHGRVLTVDEDRILREARHQAVRLWQKMAG